MKILQLLETISLADAKNPFGIVLRRLEKMGFVARDTTSNFSTLSISDGDAYIRGYLSMRHLVKGLGHTTRIDDTMDSTYYFKIEFRNSHNKSVSETEFNFRDEKSALKFYKKIQKMVDTLHDKHVLSIGKERNDYRQLKRLVNKIESNGIVVQYIWKLMHMKKKKTTNVRPYPIWAEYNNVNVFVKKDGTYKVENNKQQFNNIQDVKNFIDDEDKQ